MSQEKKRDQKAYPRNLLEASNLVHVAKSVGINRNAIEDDVEYLLYQFISKSNQTFQDFDDLWNELHFSHIHFACVKREYRDSYLNAFFSCFLDYFKSGLTCMQCAVLFSIYFLYISQPSIWVKTRIRVTKELYSMLFQFYVESIKTEKNIEAALIFDKLRELQAFLFVAEQEPNQRYVQENIEFESAISVNNDLHKLRINKIQQDPVELCLNSDIQEYKRLASLYQTSKRKVFYTPQATIATQKLLKETSNVVEKRPRLLQNVILNSTLAQDETITMKQLTKSAQQILNSKKRKLLEEKSVQQHQHE